MRENSSRRNDESPSVRTDRVKCKVTGKLVTRISRFEHELLPHCMLFENNVPSVLLRELLEEPLQIRVQPWISRFLYGFITSIQTMHESDISDFVKASKKRAKLFCEFVWDSIAAIQKGLVPVLVNRNFDEITEDFKLPFVRSFVGVDPNEPDKSVTLEVTWRQHPREYRELYRAYLLGLLTEDVNINQIATLGVILQSYAHIYESVAMTDREILEAEEEFISNVQAADVYDPNGEVAQLLDTLRRDINRRNDAPAYCHDLYRTRRHFNGYLHGQPWTLRSGWYSLKSSGTKLPFKIPNVGIVTSLIETDYSDPIDETIRYISMYPTQCFPGITQYASLSMFVPKTSSRGLRAIHPQSNPKQDRGQYVQEMCEHPLKDIIAGDCTSGHQLGVNFIAEATRQRYPGYTLVCTDIKAATDMTSHRFLMQVWKILFPDGFPEFLLRLHAGEGTIRRHVMTRNGLRRSEESYTMSSGIRCGTNSNFATCLAIPHHVIVRCVMLLNDMKDVDPSTIYRLVGDDVTFLLPDAIVDKFVDDYIRLMNAVGFRVHPLGEKGIVSRSTDLAFRAEFSKQMWVNGGILSRIPLRLFFATNDSHKVLSAYLWLAQYSLLQISPKEILDLFRGLPWPDDRKIMGVKAWNFMQKHGFFRLPDTFYFSQVPLTSEDEFKLALAMFKRVFEDSVYDLMLNNRSRLSESEVEEKKKKFFNLTDDDSIVNGFIDHYETHTPEGMRGKYLMTTDRNEQLMKAVSSLFDDSLIEHAVKLGLFPDEERELIRAAVSILQSPDSVEDREDAISTLIRVRQIFNSVQPHSLSKSHGRISRTFFRLLNDLVIAC